MKKKILIIALVLFRLTSFSQTPNGTVNLGILECFEGYTGAGAITNGTGATWIGDAGTNMGTINGFGSPPFFIGNTYNADAVTAQCRFDLFRLYIHLNDLFVDYPATHAPAFGGGETLTPGVYSIPAAGSIGAALTLDGGGNPNAFFIIKFFGAMTVGAGAVVNLTGGTQSCNVFFIADGAISVAASANLKGTLFAKLGAVGLGAGAVLEGRMLTLEGALVAGVGAIVGPPLGTCAIPIFCESDCSPAPSVDVLGVLSNYALYTNLGAVPNTSTSGIDGNIGTDVGSISGFGSSIVIGAYHTADASTTQANIDLDNAYNSLMALPNTVPSDVGVLPVVLLDHAATFGSVAPGGETINAGVYFINGAGSLGGTLVLDGQSNPDAIFVFKFAGAFSVAAQAKMILINGSRRCNVFFIGGAGVATGAISIGAGAVLKGTFLSHSGACGSGASVFLAGRQLSTSGSVTTYSGIIYNNPKCVISDGCSVFLPIELLSFTSECNKQDVLLKWSTATETNNNYFTIERCADGINWEALSTLSGAGNSSIVKNYSTIDTAPYNHTAYYRLKQTDYDGKFNFSNIVAIENCKENITTLSIYPNPAHEGQNININFASTTKQSVLVTAVDVFGQEYYSKIIVLEKGATLIAIEPYKKLAAGMYVVIAKTSNYKEIFSQKIIIN